jgi:hypothetical protein
MATDPYSYVANNIDPNRSTELEENARLQKNIAEAMPFGEREMGGGKWQ